MKVTKRNLAKTVTLAVVMATAVSVASAAELQSGDVTEILKDGSYTLATDDVAITCDGMTKPYSTSMEGIVVADSDVTIGAGQSLSITHTAFGGDYYGTFYNSNVNEKGQNNGKLTLHQKDEVGNALAGFTDTVSNIYVNEFVATADDGNAVYAPNNAQITIDAKKITINAAFGDGCAANPVLSAHGVYVQGADSTVNLHNFDELNITLDNTSGVAGEGGSALFANVGGTLDVDGKNATLASDGRSAINVMGGSTITVDVDSLSATSKNLTGKALRKNTVIAADGKNTILNINVKDSLMVGSESDATRAIGAASGAAITVDGTADMTINGAVQADSTSTVDSSISLKGNNISITATGNDGSQTDGAVRNADIVATGTVTIDAKGDLCGIGAGPSTDLRPFTTNSITADKLIINSAGAFGVYANDHAWHTVGTVMHTSLNANDISITSKKDGICAMNGAVIEAKGFDTLSIESQEQGINSEFGEITIDGGAASITADEEGIRSKHGGNIAISGDSLKLKSGLEAIKLTGSSVATVMTDLTQIDGDITLADTSKVIVNVVGNQSYLNGQFTTADTADSTLILKKGGVWYSNAQGAEDDGIALMDLRSGKENSVTRIITDGGVIDLGDGSKVHVGSLEGDDLTVKTDSTDSRLGVDNASDTDITIHGSKKIMAGIEAGDIDVNDLLNVVQNKQLVTGIDVEEGNILGDIHLNVSNGMIKGDMQVSENHYNAGLIDMAVLSAMSWRSEFDDLNTRLGDIRGGEENGLWTRFNRGETSYKSATNQANMYQIGYDRQAGDWTVGLAYSYTDGSSSFADGSGDNKHNVVSLYGTKMNENGTYLDLVAKYGNLDYDYEMIGGIGNTDFDTDAYAFSAEVGKRLTTSTGAWVEPQFQLTYGTVDSVSLTSANGVRVHQNSIDSFVARAGIMAGKPFAKGDIYLRASYLYDFEGEVKASFSNANVMADINRDLGGGWWEVGVGMHANLSDVTRLYLDFEKAFAGEVDTDWKWNAGVRYSF